MHFFYVTGCEYFRLFNLQNTEREEKYEASIQDLEIRLKNVSSILK